MGSHQYYRLARGRNAPRTPIAIANRRRGRARTKKDIKSSRREQHSRQLIKNWKEKKETEMKSLWRVSTAPQQCRVDGSLTPHPLAVSSHTRRICAVWGCCIICFVLLFWGRGRANCLNELAFTHVHAVRQHKWVSDGEGRIAAGVGGNRGDACVAMQ